MTSSAASIPRFFEDAADGFFSLPPCLLLLPGKNFPRNDSGNRR